MRAVFALVALLAAAPIAAVAGTAPADHGAKIYQRCAACHLPNGAGISGAFPALAGRLSKAAETDGGRAYLVMTVATGVMGEIEIDGKKIRGVMPAQAGLTDADIAAVLNHTLAFKSAAPAAPKPPKAFTADEVAAIKKAIVAPTPTTVHAMRSAAFPSTAQEMK